MAMEPDILLMDEPFAALDALTRRKMQEELLQLWEDTRFTVLFVTHSIEEAIIVGSRILVLSPASGPREGRAQCAPVRPCRAGRCGPRPPTPPRETRASGVTPQTPPRALRARGSPARAVQRAPLHRDACAIPA